MTQLSRRLALGALLLFGFGSAHAQVVISQAYGGGGNTGAALKSDFIELHNNGASAVDVSTWSVQYASSAGTSWSKTNLSGSIPAGGYYLIKQADGTGAVPAITNQDATGTIAMSGTAFKLALVNSTTALTGSCPTGAAIQDFVGAGSAANCFEGTSYAPAPSNTSAIVRLGGGCTDTNVNSLDFETVAQPLTPRNTGSAVLACSVVGPPTISIDDVTKAEGNSGTSTFTFTVSLSAPAPEGGVSFDVATADGTASAGFDYVAKALVGQVIPAGASTYAFDVTVNGDTDIEGNESFLVTLTNVDGAGEGDFSGLGTIQNDDVAALPINQIQGSGTASPYDGMAVVTEGVVTLVRSNGFYLQSITPDADPATSEGIFVFTGGAPTVSAGDRAQVTGTVDEFLPVAYTYPVTELVPSNVVKVGTAAIPAPVELTAADFAGPLIDPDVLEHLEGMYVHIASGKIVAPTRSATTEFEIVVTGVPRPIREAGISIFDPFVVPAGKEATIPYFDANQERIKLRPISGNTPLVEARGSVSDIYGALDYAGASSAVNSWQVWYDPSQAQTQIVSGTPKAVSDASADDVTIAGFNMEWFFVDSMDGQSGTEAQRRSKIAAVVCDWLKTPDILATEEVDDLTTLQDLASQINTQCQSAPAYEAHMLDTDPGNQQRLGFLISKRVVTGVTPRVDLVDIQQHNETTLLKDPNGNPVAGEELNDRPPLRMKAVVHFADGRQYPVTVIAVHQKSLIAVDSVDAGRNGYPTEGARNRGKRAQQAVELAQLVKDIQSGTIGGNPNEKIVLVGDFNSFDVNDGYVDVMGITTGHPAPEPEVVLYADSPLSVANGGTPLIVGNQLTADPEERYSYVFGNISQSLDHALINQALLDDAAITDISVDHARVNADFRPADANVYYESYSVENPPLRTSDHDPVRVSIRLAEVRSADLSVTASAESTQIGVGQVAVFHIDASNAGPSTTVPASLSIVFNALVMPTVTAPSGWTCSAATQDAPAHTTTVACTAAAFTSGGAASFTVNVPTTGNVALEMTTTIGSSVSDPSAANNSASAEVLVGQAADLSLAFSAPQPGGRGVAYSDTLTLHNDGPNAAIGAQLHLYLDTTDATVMTVLAPAGWSCRSSTPHYTYDCTASAPVAVGATVKFVVNQRDSRSHKTSNPYRLEAHIQASTLDPAAGNNEAVQIGQ